MARPSKLNKEIADLICNRIADGETLRAICNDEKLPCRKTVYNWLLDVENSWFLHQYTRAREIQADVLVDEILEISDDGSRDYDEVEGRTVVDHDHIARSRLRVDSRKWFASKVAPKKYGEKITTEHTGNLQHSVKIEFIDAEVSE